ncbi:hypothetical protein D3C74_334110 [compost metagenome]
MLNDCGDGYKRDALEPALGDVLLYADAKRDLPGGNHRLSAAGAGKEDIHIQPFLGEIPLVLSDVKAGMIGVRAPVEHNLDAAQLFAGRLVRRGILGILPALVSCSSLARAISVGSAAGRQN